MLEKLLNHLTGVFCEPLCTGTIIIVQLDLEAFHYHNASSD